MFFVNYLGIVKRRQVTNVVETGSTRGFWQQMQTLKRNKHAKMGIQNQNSNMWKILVKTR